MLLFDPFLFVFSHLRQERKAEAMDYSGCSQSGTFRTYAIWRVPGGQCINYQTCHSYPAKPPSLPIFFYQQVYLEYWVFRFVFRVGS